MVRKQMISVPAICEIVKFPQNRNGIEAISQPLTLEDKRNLAIHLELSGLASEISSVKKTKPA
jgi:hypothetical protein